MRFTNPRLLLAGLCLAILMAGCADQNPQVVIKTELGDIKVEIYETECPATAANFFAYLTAHRFKDATFYRTVRMDNQPDKNIKIEVIQGGLKNDDSGLRLAPIKHETTAQTGILHKDGTISMARVEPGTASSEFFICVGDQPELDFGGKRNPDGQGFAAFGQVVEGMDVVRRIHTQPADGQWLIPEIRIADVIHVGSATTE